MFRSLITGLPLNREVKPLRRLTAQQEQANVGGPQSFTGQPMQTSVQGKQMGYQVATNKFPTTALHAHPSTPQIGGPQIQGGSMHKSSSSKKGSVGSRGGSVMSSVANSIAAPAKFVKKRNLVTHF